MVILARWLLTILMATSLPSTVQADDCGLQQVIGQVKSATNDVSIVRSETDLPIPIGQIHSIEHASEGIVCSGDEVRVGSSSQAFLLLGALNTLLRLDADTVLILGDSSLAMRAYVAGNNADDLYEQCLHTLNRGWLWLKRGAIRLFTTRPQELDVFTDYLNASIEGTEFAVLATDVESRVDVTQGEVAICNIIGKEAGKEPLLLTSGKSGRAERSKPPEYASPEESVQWAVHFPELGAVIDTGSLAYRALMSAREGRVEDALESLDGSGSALELALQSIMHLVLNDVDEASDDALEAVNVNAQEPTAWLALSYAHQAEFRIEDALRSIETAVALLNGRPRPYSARSDIRIRKVELLQVNGFSSEALVQGKAVVREFADSARAHTVLGFLQLYNYELAEARRSFEEAVLLDVSDPLPHLGLSLSYMREGDYVRAKLEMEIAVNLNPLRSLSRSYLARVYLELGLHDQAAEQLEVARVLDANDPTPVLFDAVLKQALGKAPEALSDLHEAGYRVSRRGVYRSSIAQDTDMAVVLSSRARIYEELGFGQLTLLDGAESLQRDPQSYVGHRMMADAFLNRPRQELSRQSELLQAQVRQPLNNHPGQYRLYDSRLSTLSDSGPFAASFNEYTRLFTTEGFSGRLGVEAGSFASKGIEAQMTYLNGNTLGAISGYESATDGTGENRDEKLGIVSGFVQHRANSRLDLQSEYRRTVFEGGDDYIGFAPAIHDRGVRNREEKTIVRMSANFRQTDDKSWLLNLEHGYTKDTAQGLCDSGDAIRDTIDGDVMDLQFAKDMAGRDLIAGFLHSHQTIKFGNTAGDVNCLEGRGDGTTRPVRETSWYSYLYSPLYEVAGKKVDVILGLSYDQSSGRAGRRKESVNPKLGLAWSSGSTRIRLAALRAVDRTLISARTLEPTQVMGFTQRVDQAFVDTTRLVALGIDRSFSINSFPAIGRINVGGEISARRTVVASRAERKPESSELNLKLFSYMPLPKSSIGVVWSTSDWNSRNSDGPEEELKRSTGLTHRLDIGLKQFWSDLFTTSVTVKWRSQDGEFYSFTRPLSLIGSTVFWTLDLSAKWNLTKVLPNGHDAGFTVGVENLLDERFNFEDEDPLDPQLAYQRTISLKLESRFK